LLTTLETFQEQPNTFKLLGQLRQEESLASLILRKSGVTLEKVRELVKQLLMEEQTKSVPEPEQLLNDCLEKVHRDILTCWNFKGEVLKC